MKAEAAHINKQLGTMRASRPGSAGAGRPGTVGHRGKDDVISGASMPGASSVFRCCTSARTLAVRTARMHLPVHEMLDDRKGVARRRKMVRGREISIRLFPFAFLSASFDMSSLEDLRLEFSERDISNAAKFPEMMSQVACYILFARKSAAIFTMRPDSISAKPAHCQPSFCSHMAWPLRDRRLLNLSMSS